MRHLAFSAIIMLALGGCGGPNGEPAAKPGAPEQQPEAAAAASDSPVSMTGSMTLKFFSSQVGSDQPSGATFEVSSPKCSLVEDGVWALTPATAIVYGKGGEQTRFEAGSAQFDDNSKIASLKDGVKVDIGTQHVELQDMTWSNNEGVAKSDHAVTVTDGATRLSAMGMEFRSESKTLLLQHVTGTISLKERSESP